MIHDPIRSSITSAAKEYFGKAERRFFLMAGGQYLHWSGAMLTSKRRDAWRGTIDQARACRRVFDAAAGCRAIPVASVTPTLQTVGV